MTKTRLKFLCIIFGFCFLVFAFWLLPAHKVFAADLEVKYPVISGQTLGTDTKLPDYVLYLFNLGMFVGFFSVFISLVWAGVLYFLSPISADLRADAKDRATGAISGLLILALTYLIVTTINPQLSFLNFNKLPETPPAPAEKKSPGVYFYKNKNCSDTDAQPNTSSMKDLGDSLRNKVNAVRITQDSDNQTYYVSVLYDTVNFQGMCQSLDPQQAGCQTVPSFGNSASIYQYDPDPNGDGVYFYRKSGFNDSGGFLKISNSQIKGGYVHELDGPDGLTFQNVPEDEQDCVKYDDNGKCAQDGRKPPTLGGENISSVKINGNYIVYFVYAGPEDNPEGPWTYCQAFPTIDDVNKLGPVQIKWEKIRSRNGFVPNYVFIDPVAEK